MPSTGIVKFFNTAKGFGFISPQNGSQDVFVRISEVERAALSTLTENQRISFEVQRGAERQMLRRKPQGAVIARG